MLTDLTSPPPRLLVALLLLLGLSPLTAGDSIEWNKARNLVSADLNTDDLEAVLKQIAKETGWQVYLEPGVSRRVNTAFKDRTPDKALDLILGKLNRALLPPTNGAPRLLVFETHRSKATKRINTRGAKHTMPIPNQLVVRLKPGVDIGPIAKMLGAKVVASHEASNTHLLEFDNEADAIAARKLLEDNREIASIQNNYPIQGDLPTRQAQGARAPTLKAKPAGDADQIIVGLIDTMVDPNQGVTKDFLLPGISVAGEATHPGDGPLHGDSMAQTIIKALALTAEGNEGSQVRILPVDVYGNEGSTTTFHVALGIGAAIEAGATIINLSMGTDTDASYLHEIIQQGHAQGITFFGAAGNEPTTDISFPAYYNEVIAVTSTDRSGNIAAFANRGDFVDIATPGSTLVLFGDQSFHVGGTSVSSAGAAGIAAGITEQTGLTGSQLQNKMIQDLQVNRTKVVP